MISKEELDFLIEASDDTVGLWSVAWRFRANPERKRELTLAMLQHMLSGGLVEAGEFGPDREFRVWGVSASETMRRVESFWDELGRDPGIGEGPWFVGTSTGRKLVESNADAPEG